MAQYCPKAEYRSRKTTLKTTMTKHADLRGGIIDKTTIDYDNNTKNWDCSSESFPPIDIHVLILNIYSWTRVGWGFSFLMSWAIPQRSRTGRDKMRISAPAPDCKWRRFLKHHLHFRSSKQQQQTILPSLFQNVFNESSLRRPIPQSHPSIRPYPGRLALLPWVYLQRIDWRCRVRLNWLQKIKRDRL
jgi:hypothetical protein